MPGSGSMLADDALNSRSRWAVHARGHFPTEQAAMKVLYLVTRAPIQTRLGKVRAISTSLSRSGEGCTDNRATLRVNRGVSRSFAK